MTAIRRLARALTCAAAVVASASAVSTQTNARTVVIAELFTSLEIIREYRFRREPPR